MAVKNLTVIDSIADLVAYGAEDYYITGVGVGGGVFYPAKINIPVQTEYHCKDVPDELVIISIAIITILFLFQPN
jgi:hypothetical protein